MSEEMRRRKLARLHQEKADLEKRRGQEARKLEKLNLEIAKARRAMLSTKSDSMRRSKGRQIESKAKDAVKVQGKIAKLDSQVASNLSEQAKVQRQLGRAVEQRRQKEETEDKKRQADRLRGEKAVTREIRAQNRLYSERLTAEQLRELPEKIKVLFLAADPLDQQRLRLDREVRNISERLSMAKYRDAVELESRWAVRTGDLLQAVNEVKPRVVHFAGHGSESDELVFEDESGNPKAVSKEAITRFIEVGSDHVQVVVFNACYTRDQAKAAVRHVDVAVGMNAPISDEAARTFAEQFYSAIGFGASVKRAFDQARTRLAIESIPEEKTPEIFAREGVNPDEVVLVRPEEERRVS